MTVSKQEAQLVRVLYVDDYPMDRELVRNALAAHGGFRLTEAASREEFEEYLAGGDFDLVLSDFNILGFEGLQVIDAVSARSPNAPVMIVTGTGSEEIAIESLRRGAADYVIKTPEHIRRLPASIAAVLEAARLSSEGQRAETALRESEEKYRLLAEHSTDMISKHDLDGVYNYASLACKLLLGYDPEELVGQNGFDLLHPDDAQRVAERYRAVLAGGEFYPLEFRYRCKDGRYKWIESTASIVRDDKTGEPIEIIAVGRDVSARKLAEETLETREKLYRDAISAADSVVYHRDFGRGRFAYMGSGIDRLLGRPADEVTPDVLKGFIVRSVMRGEATGLSTHEALERLTSDSLSIWTADYECEVPGKEALWLSDTAVPIRGNDGRVTGSLGILQDITARKQMETALRESREKIEASHNQLFEAIESLTEGFALYDSQDRLVIWLFASICG